MPIHNSLEYSKNYRKATGSLWNYYSDEPKSGAEGNYRKSTIQLRIQNLLTIKQVLWVSYKIIEIN